MKKMWGVIDTTTNELKSFYTNTGTRWVWDTQQQPNRHTKKNPDLKKVKVYLVPETAVESYANAMPKPAYVGKHGAKASFKNKVAAIKAIRAATGLSLAESKLLVESLEVSIQVHP